MERLFDHFPGDGVTCPICGKSDDSQCFLIPIDGTDDKEGRICEAQVFHRKCFDLEKLRYNRKYEIIYMKVEKP